MTKALSNRRKSIVLSVEKGISFFSPERSLAYIYNARCYVMKMKAVMKIMMF